MDRRIKLIAELKDFGTKEAPIIKGVEEVTDAPYHFVYGFKTPNGEHIAKHPTQDDTIAVVAIFSDRPNPDKEYEKQQLYKGLAEIMAYGVVDLPVSEYTKAKVSEAVYTGAPVKDAVDALAREVDLSLS